MRRVTSASESDLSNPSHTFSATLSVSNRGRAALERLAPVQRQVNDVEFGCLSHEEFALLTGIVDRLIDSGAKAVALQSYLLAELGDR